MPTEKGRTTLIDVGANPNCKPIHFLQYAIMASIYSKALFNNVESPSIGLLNIGAESEKGTMLSREVYQYFKKSSLNFIGNVEGHELFTGKCDVVVCDGFVGNTILKTSEGLVDTAVKTSRSGAPRAALAARRPASMYAHNHARSVAARWLATTAEFPRQWRWALGIGAGANVLVGGSNRSFTLQPLSLEAQRGVNVTASITELRLRPR